MEQNKAIIKEYLTDNFSNLEVTEEMDIFSTGVINSLFAMQLILFLQNKFNIIIGSEDLDFDNFKSVNSMAELVENKVKISKEA